MPHSATPFAKSEPAALLRAARSLGMHRLCLLLSCLQEPRASWIRVLLQALVVLWCYLWTRGPQPVLVSEAVRVLPVSIVLFVVACAWALWINRFPDRGTQWRDAAGLVLSLVMIGAQVAPAFILLMALNAILPFLVIAATVVYGRIAIVPSIAATTTALLSAAPDGYWISRPAYLAYALCLTILLPAVVAAMVAAMRDIALQAVASRSAQGRFVGAMSHELRTPLNAIINGIQLMEVDDIAQAQRRALDVVAKNARALRHRIDDVLDVASIDGGTLQLRSQACSLASILDAMLASCEPYAADKGVVLRVDGDTSAIWMLADAGRIEQVITNLVGNAIKYSPMGGQAGVAVQAVRGYSSWIVRIAVSDSGDGIDEKDRDSIFSPFVQLSEGEARCEQGVGLGLYIVRWISDAMNGSIEVGRSASGGGLFVWRFTVPVAEEAPAAPSLDQLLQDHSASVRSLHCLLFEDVETNRQVVEKLLDCAGHRISCRCDGRDAQETIETLAPDVVLLDLHMPGCSGWEVLEMIGRLPAPPPVLVMSADTRVQVIERAQALGAAGFLCKPLEVQEVLDKLRDVACGATPCAAL